VTTTSVATLVELNNALAAAATNGQADIIILTANISAASGADFTTGVGGRDLVKIAVTDGQTLSIVGGGFTLDANHLGRVLEVSSGTVAISDLTIREGSLAAAGGDHSQVGGSALGGGIYNTGSLTLTGVTVTANSAAGGGGGGGGYYSGGGSGAGGGANDGSRFAGDGGSGFGGRGGGTTYSGGGASSGSGGAGGVPSSSYVYAASGGTSGGGGGGYYNAGRGGAGGTAAVGGGLSASGNIGGGISIGGGGGGAGQGTSGGGGATHGVGAGGAAVGGIYNAGTLTLAGGAVSGNVAAGGGGGVNPDYGVYGIGGAAVGGIHNAGVLRLEGAATVTGNVGVGGFGGHQGIQSSVNGASSADFSGTAAAPANHAPTGGVSITGTATQGQVLTATNTLADTDGLGTLSYQWKSDAANISGATASTFTLTQAQVGHLLSVAVSYTDGGSTVETVTSAGTTFVANVNDAPTGAVAIAGTATQGQTLTASNTLADVDGLGTISYQWKSDGAAISGATSATFTLTQAQAGHVVTVAASYTDGFSHAESVTSSGTASVANLNDAPTGSVSIAGTATPGPDPYRVQHLGRPRRSGRDHLSVGSPTAPPSPARRPRPSPSPRRRSATRSPSSPAIPTASATRRPSPRPRSPPPRPRRPRSPSPSPSPSRPAPPAVVTVVTASGNSVTGGAEANVIASSGGADTVSAGAGDDTVAGGSLNDVLQGNQDQDSIAGGGGDDLIYGGQGDDVLQGDAGDDVLFGDKGADRVSGGQGADLMQGGQGDDYLSGDVGDDVVRGGQGDDRVFGGDGSDFLSGDRGDDTLTGGAGADTFYSFGGAGIDLISDFNRAEGDHIQLEAGTAYTVSQVGADVHIDMTGGAEIILAGVQLSSLTASGRWQVKVAPFPGSLSSATQPPCSSTSALTRARPRPGPPRSRVVKRSKMWAWVWNGMPRPVSATCRRTSPSARRAPG
jgi:hypothetical protein